MPADVEKLEEYSVQVRDRIRELRRVRAGDLRPNKRNWRTHPPAQRAVLRGVLAEIGYADALLARELPDGRLELIDGHLRAETTPDALVPVLVVDVDASEAELLLAVLDPLAGMAETDAARLEKLLAEVRSESEAVQAMLGEMLEGADREPPVVGDEAERVIPEVYQVVVDCRDEEEQRTVYERLAGEGHACRLVTL